MNNEGALPLISDCRGCGVCCLHMGYPAFNLPLDELVGQQATSEGSPQPGDGRQQAELPVRSQDRIRWNHLPVDLRMELQEHIREYQGPESGQLDSACIWLDPTTRLCKHHEHRPQICRDFEIGSALCQEWRRSYRELIQPPSRG